MRILFLDQFAEIGGAQRCLLDLLPAVGERGWTACAATPGEGPFTEALRAEGVETQSIPCGPYGLGGKSASDAVRFAFDVPRQARAIAWLAQRIHADLLFVNGPRLLPAAAWAARKGIPMWFHSHNHLAQRYAVETAGRSLQAVDAGVIACSHFVAGPLVPYVPKDHLHIVYNGVPELPPRQRRFPSDARWRIGVVGRLAPEKGQAGFLEAARLLTAAGAHAEYIVCGGAGFGDSRYPGRLRELAAGLPVAFLDWQEDVAGVIGGLDLLVVPSTVPEATPRVIMEAYAAGTPVLAVAAGGVPEIARHLETAFLVESSSAASIARGIQELMAAPQRLGTLAAGGFAAWRGRFTLERYRAQVLDSIEAGSRTAARR